MGDHITWEQRPLGRHCDFRPCRRLAKHLVVGSRHGTSTDDWRAYIALTCDRHADPAIVEDVIRRVEAQQPSVPAGRVRPG